MRSPQRHCLGLWLGYVLLQVLLRSVPPTVLTDRLSAAPRSLLSLSTLHRALGTHPLPRRAYDYARRRFFYRLNRRAKRRKCCGTFRLRCPPRHCAPPTPAFTRRDVLDHMLSVDAECEQGCTPRSLGGSGDFSPYNFRRSPA